MIKRIDDIDKKKRQEERKRIKSEIAEDISEIAEDTFNRIEDFFKRKQIENEIIEGKRSKWGRIGKKSLGVSWIIGLVILTINFVLGNIWLLRYLIKSLFIK